MAGVLWGLVILAAGYLALTNRDRLEAFARGIHSDRYASVGTWAFIGAIFCMGVWVVVAGVWSILS